VELRSENGNSEKQICRARDLTCSGSGLLLWCLPAVALVAGLHSNAVRTWLGIPAFSVMGFGCLANAARCGRLHCYLMGPSFLLAALYLGAALLRAVPFAPAALIDAVFALVILSFLIEIPLGRYRSRG
jgi:hypothetical protein